MENNDGKGEKLIEAELYGGPISLFGNSKSPYSLDLVFCSKSDSCPLLKKKACIMSGRTFFNREILCPYCRTENKKGTGYRSKTYTALNAEYHSLSKDVQGTLKTFGGHYAEIGDFCFIKLPYVNFFVACGVPVRVSGYASDEPKEGETETRGGAMIAKSLFTKELFESLRKLDVRKGFQYDPFPEYAKTEFPDFMAEIALEYPGTAARLGIRKEEVSYVGMMGRLNTLKPGIDVSIPLHNFSFKAHWDGLRLTVVSPDVPKAVDRDLSDPSPWSVGTVDPSSSLVFIPNPDLFVEIESNDWVNPNTKIKPRKEK
jgi:hypothetical protein